MRAENIYRNLLIIIFGIEAIGSLVLQRAGMYIIFSGATFGMLFNVLQKKKKYRDVRRLKSNGKAL